MKTLLLNNTYEGISFISFRKVFKLLSKDKIEILSEWNDRIYWGRGNMKLPSVVRLKYRVRWIPKKMRFNRGGVFRRDRFQCQYCGETFSQSKLTVDHVMPQARNGKSDWLNCVASCFECNNKKGNKTPAEAGMKLLSVPAVPCANLVNESINISPQHPDWKVYLGI
jgi:hypothetical protein